MSYFLLLFEFIFHFGLELFFIFFLKEYYIFQIFISIDIILSSFLYFYKVMLYLLEVFNITVFFYALIYLNFYISTLWIYILLKNYIRHFFFYHFFYHHHISRIEPSEIDIINELQI